MILSRLKHNMKSGQNEEITLKVNNTLIKHKSCFPSILGGV